MNITLQEALNDMVEGIVYHLERIYKVKPTFYHVDNDSFMIKWTMDYGEKHTITVVYDEDDDSFTLYKYKHGKKTDTYKFNDLDDVWDQIYFIINHIKPRMVY